MSQGQQVLEPTRAPGAYRAGQTVSADGTRIAFYATAAPAGPAKTIVIAQGLGAPRQAWDPVVAYLGDRYRFVTWDYRGLYASDRPAAGGDAYAIARHADDLLAVLDATGTASAAIIGWSMGAQVALEAYRRAPARVAAMALVNGTFGLDDGGPVRKWTVLRARRVAIDYPNATRRVQVALSERRSLTRWLLRLGVMGAAAHDAGYEEVVRRLGEVDMEAFLRNFEALERHDASRILPTVEAPVLVVTGDRDRVASTGLSQRMMRKLPSAKLMVIRGGTHFVPLEFPELLSLRIERFFREFGFAP